MDFKYFNTGRGNGENVYGVAKWQEILLSVDITSEPQAEVSTTLTVCQFLPERHTAFLLPSRLGAQYSS